MAVVNLTIEDILETLSDNEKHEVLRSDFMVPLKHYLTGYNRSPAFPPDFVIDKFRKYAKRRVAVKNEIIKNPDILKVDLKDPIFIIGLARSGTTFLHRLMTSDPQFMAPMLWEMLEPTPPGRPENWKESERFKKASEDPELAPLTAGGLDPGHYTRMELPEECYVILRLYFLDLLDPFPNPNMKELMDHLFSCSDDHIKNAYDFHKKCLQCLFYGNFMPGNTALLKCPVHSLFLETIQKIHPTAKFIFLHRNAKETVTSFSALVNHVWNMQTNKEDHFGAGQRILELAKHSSVKMVHFLKQLSKERYISVPYTKLVDNPIDTVTEIYSHFHLELKSETVELMQKFQKDNFQYKHGRIHYQAEDYGITDEALKENLKEYLEFCKHF